jgi:hypothetical protein
MEVQPMSVWEPRNVNELRGIVLGAHNHDIQVKAVGSGCSWTDIIHTSGFIIKPNKLNKPLKLNKSVLKDSVDTSHLVKVESGTTVREINDFLDKKDLALSNMGGYDGQTIIGATSTSTHGSGIKHGPLSDMIQSLDIVAKNGDLFRIEPSIGITDPGKFKPKNKVGTLIQDDKFFSAASVGVGCMGIIYSVILKVRDAFNLQEVRTLSTWEKVKKDLKNGSVLKNNEHYEILINPYKLNNKYECLITTRNTKKSSQGLSKKDKKRNFFPELGSSLGIVTDLIFNQFRDHPQNSPKLLSKAIKGLKDNSYFNKSYKVYNIGAANDIPSLSSEIALPMKNDKYLKGIEHMLKVIELNTSKNRGGLYHSGPISFRFVKGSHSFLSPQYKQDTCMIEIIMMKKTFGAMAMYETIEKELYPFGARPHWGQINFLNASAVRSMYPKLTEWNEVRAFLDPKGIFRNSFTDRIGV